MGPPRGTTDDLAKLENLDEQGLIEELHQRYRRDFIYTYIGDILISVNPYKELTGFYGEEIGHRYAAIKSLGDLKPHVYAIGSQIYQNVQRRQGNQCVLVSGESGAGKTEITKMIVAQIARMSHIGGDYFLQERIVEVNPLLEAFGNATTVMNDNSSRFGKLIELSFSEEGKLLGACITEHMLEKSRVVGQATGEKNFHIFYNLMCGFTQEERQRYFLERPEKYRVLDPGHGDPVIASQLDYNGYAETMNNLRRIMPIVGFTHQDMDVVFALLAAILHLCNIELAVEPESDEVIVMNEEEIDYAATLLSVKAEDLITVILANINWVRGERIVYIKTLNQSVDGRDALAKALYSRLFSWIVQQINFMLHVEPSEGQTFVISILDMAGFEHFPVNSFEQLCINAANERLQHYFNEHIFSLELQEYQAEGIKPPKVKFSNNTDLLNMLFQRHYGLFSLLEEECILAKTTDMTLVDKLNLQFGKSNLYRKSKHREPVFGIVHYAGLVSYTANNFLEKNRETLSSNMFSLMENSQNNLVNELFGTPVLNTGTLDMRQGSGKNNWKRPSFSQPPQRNYAPGDSLSRQAGRKIRQRMKEQKEFQDIPVTNNPNTASAYFKNSLQLLLDKLKGAEPHFIRCIKPNNHKMPSAFDSKIVVEQLRSTGVLETTKIRRLGYAIRLPFSVFFQRYRMIVFPATANIEPTARACSHILHRAKLSDVQVGQSKVFLKYWQCDHLNAIMDSMLVKLLRAQASIRAFLQRKMFKHYQQMAIQDEDDLRMLGQYIDNCGNELFQNLCEQNNTDVARATKARHTVSNGFNSNTPHVPSIYTADQDIGMPDVFSPAAPSIVDQDSFYRMVTNQVCEKLHELDSDVWCKILYMEYNKQVAKFYICDKEVVIDGSMEEFTGTRIGLGVFNNQQRDDVTQQIRGFIGKGLSISRLPDGSIAAVRLGKNPVVIKGCQDPSNHCLSAEAIMNEGLLPQNYTIKIFDMDEMKSHMGIAMRSASVDRSQLQRLSVCGLSFIQDEEEDLQTPCWLCIINIQALKALNDPDVKKEVQQKFVELSLRDQSQVEEQEKLQEMANRHQRNWSKITARQMSQAGKEPLRKARLQIKKQGEDIKGRMDYSWLDSQEEMKGKNITQLHEEFDRFDDNVSIMPGPARGLTPVRHSSMASSAGFSEITPTRKKWSRIDVMLSQTDAQEAEKMQKSRKSRDFT